MAFKTITQKVASKQLLKQIETKVSGKIAIDDERVVERALCGSGNATITSEEKIGDYIQFTGSVSFNVLFAVHGGSVDAEKITLDFNEKTSNINVDNFVLVPEVVSYKVQKESDKVINVTIVIKTKIYGDNGEEATFLIGEEEGFYTQSKEVQADNLAVVSSSSFNLSGSASALDKIDKILYSSANVNLAKLIPHDNYAVIEGVCEVDVVYISDGVIKKQNKIIDFSEEVACINLTSDMQVYADLFIKNVVGSVEEKEDLSKTILNIDLSLGYALWGYAKNSYAVITDIFSDKNDVSLTYGAFNTNVVQDIKILSDRQAVVVDMVENKRMDEILNILGLSPVVNKVCQHNGKLVISGDLKANIIFKNYDSEEILSSDVNVPFELNFGTSEIPEDAYIDAEVIARVSSYKNKAGKDISIVIDYDIMLMSSLSDKESVVNKIETGDTFENIQHSIIVYKPESGESSFDIAKNLKISPDVLLAQNPQLGSGERVEKVVIYRKIN